MRPNEIILQKLYTTKEFLDHYKCEKKTSLV